MIALYVLISILATAVVVSLGWAAWQGVKEERRVRLEGYQKMELLTKHLWDLNATISRQADAQQDGRKASEAAEEITNKLLAGLIEVSKTQVSQLEKLDSTIDMLRSALFGDNPKALQEYNARDAEMESNIIDLMKQEGVNRRSAEDRFSGIDLNSLIKEGL